MHDNNGSDLNRFGSDLFNFSASFNVGVIGANVHQIADVFAAFAHGISLKPFTDLIKEHHGNGFRVLAGIVVKCYGNGAQGSNGHQKIFIENTAVSYAFCCLEQDVIADKKIGDKVKRQSQRSRDRCKRETYEKRCCKDDAYKHLFLLCLHLLQSPSVMS